MYSALRLALVVASAFAGGTAQGTHHHVKPLRPANELGRIPILEYHVIGDSDARWTVERGHFKRQLELLYERGYRPITVAELIDRKIALPAGMSPVVFTFDDASPSQFRYIDHNGTLEIDPNSAIGIWLEFHRTHPDWANKATFCMLPGAAAGHAFFGERGIEGQKSEWRRPKVRFLAEQGFELCDHTLWHANLSKYSDEVVQEQIARGAMAIDSAVPGYRVRTFALPLGIWPKNHELAHAGSWRDARTGRVVTYRFDAILEVTGGPARSPFDPKFDPLRLPRVEVFGDALERLVDQLDRSGNRYVASGRPTGDSSTALQGASNGAGGREHEQRLRGKGGRYSAEFGEARAVVFLYSVTKAGGFRVDTRYGSEICPKMTPQCPKTVLASADTRKQVGRRSWQNDRRIGGN